MTEQEKSTVKRMAGTILPFYLAQQAYNLRAAIAAAIADAIQINDAVNQI